MVVEENNQNDFFYQNDVAVTKTAVKILRWLVLVFPVLMVVSLTGIFQTKMTSLIPLTLLGIVVTWGPTVAYKLNAPVHVMKYTVTLALGCLVAMMGTDSTIGIYMTYALAMVFSILFYDNKFTLRVSIISYVLLVISLYFRSLNVQQTEFDTNFIWFVSRCLGFLMETAVMTLICVKIADVSHKMLVNLNITQEVAQLVDKCQMASENLSGVVGNMESCIHEFRDTNQMIKNSAHTTTEDCSNSLNYVDAVYESMQNMDQTVDSITESAQQMLQIADRTTAQMEHYIVSMKQTAEGMHDIKKSALQTEHSIQGLREGMKEVEEFTRTISGITKQTNLLALNASIEAARAGEAGKGFSVVADEVRDLADDSKKASDAITGILENIFGLLSKVQDSNAMNVKYVENGIEQIQTVSEEAKTLGQLQEESRQASKQMTVSGENARESSQKVLSMAQDMHGLVENSLKQADVIVQESEGQKQVADKVEEAYNQVKQVSQELVSIGKGNL